MRESMRDMRMKTRKRVLEELEKSASKDQTDRLMIELLLDIREILLGSWTGPGAVKRRPDPRSEMTIEEIEKAFTPMLEEVKKKIGPD